MAVDRRAPKPYRNTTDAITPQLTAKQNAGVAAAITRTRRGSSSAVAYLHSSLRAVPEAALLFNFRQLPIRAL